MAGSVLLHGVLGLALLVALWPTRSTGLRFLRRWGVADPDERQGALAVKYLRDRRLLYPPLFLAAPAVAALAAHAWGLPSSDLGFVRSLAPLIVALLLAEAVAALRRARGPRVATLTRRHWRDLVPRWAIGLLLTFGAVAALLAVAGMIAQPRVDRIVALIPAGGVRESEHGTLTVAPQHLAELACPTSLVTLIGVVSGLAAALGVVRLAVRRGPVGDPRVDAALRTRSARVAVGIGIAWTASMVLVANSRLVVLGSVDFAGFPPPPDWLELVSFTELAGAPVLLAAAAGWIWVANPPRHLPYVQGAA
ncbi:hypothetical protein ACRAKI_09910 [Saccharothrix isguenensis]